MDTEKIDIVNQVETVFPLIDEIIQAHKLFAVSSFIIGGRIIVNSCLSLKVLPKEFIKALAELARDYSRHYKDEHEKD